MVSWQLPPSVRFNRIDYVNFVDLVKKIIQFYFRQIILTADLSVVKKTKHFLPNRVAGKTTTFYKVESE